MKNLLRMIKRKYYQQETITVVAGLPRSGTSLMMKMLQAGGLEPLIDNVRRADDDNLKGYYEFERVKNLKEGDVDWLKDAKGKVVKIISAHLPYLPDNYSYKIMTMRRSILEILASQKKMLIRRGEGNETMSDEHIAELSMQLLRDVADWMKNKPNIEHIEVSYNELLHNSKNEVSKVNTFLGDILEEEKMVAVIDPSLYRQRQKKLKAV